MRISDWSSDVCSSDLLHLVPGSDFALEVVGSDLSEGRRRIDAAGNDSMGFTNPPSLAGLRRILVARSEERRVGKECVSTCRSRWSPYHSKQKTTREDKSRDKRRNAIYRAQ